MTRKHGKLVQNQLIISEIEVQTTKNAIYFPSKRQDTQLPISNNNLQVGNCLPGNGLRQLNVSRCADRTRKDRLASKNI